MCIASLYFATVRRATLIPWSDRRFAILLSLSGFLMLSADISFLMTARMAVEDASPPKGRTDVARKEIFELVDASRGMQIFSSSYP